VSSGRSLQQHSPACTVCGGTDGYRVRATCEAILMYDWSNHLMSDPRETLNFVVGNNSDYRCRQCGALCRPHPARRKT
jgi:hypothetical protein